MRSRIVFALTVAALAFAYGFAVGRADGNAFAGVVAGSAGGFVLGAGAVVAWAFEVKRGRGGQVSRENGRDVVTDGGTGPRWGHAVELSDGPHWEVMGRHYWRGSARVELSSGRTAAAVYTVTFDNPIRDDYHVLRSTAGSVFLSVPFEEGLRVVAHLGRWISRGGATPPRSRARA